MKPKLAILIPTIVGREIFFEKLIRSLAEQLSAFHLMDCSSPKFLDDVIILSNKDNREKTIGQKRNELTQAAIDAGATHRAFIDDDDTVADNYLELNMPGVYGNYDCNSLVGHYFVNGVYDRPFYHSLKYTHWWQDEKGYYRNPNHLNVVKLELIKDVKFQEKNFGEDGCWSEDIARLDLLKTEYEITQPFYNYLMRTKHDGI